MKGRRAGLIGALLLSVAACGPNAEFSRLQKKETKGKYSQAWEGYQAFAADHPKHARAPEALVRAGWLSESVLGDCFMARTFYGDVLERYAESDPWARVASFRRDQCPDYFPLYEGSVWVEGDSETKGQNAKIETACRPSNAKGALPSEAGILARTYYGGKEKFKTVETVYRKADGELREFSNSDDPRGKIVLKWPLTVGARWRSPFAGRMFQFEVVDVDETIEVVAGTFSNCLKVRSTVEGSIAATVEYFAPNVGRILTAVATEKGEKRITELLSYKLPPAALMIASEKK